MRKSVFSDLLGYSPLKPSVHWTVDKMSISKMHSDKLFGGTILPVQIQFLFNDLNW